MAMSKITHRAANIPARATRLSPVNRLLKFSLVALKISKAVASTINTGITIFIGSLLKEKLDIRSKKLYRNGQQNNPEDLTDDADPILPEKPL